MIVGGEAVRFGTAAEGGSTYSVLTPTEPGRGAVGLHFFQGRLGLLCHPLLERYPIPYKAVDQEEFRAAVRHDYGFDLEGLGFK